MKKVLPNLTLLVRWVLLLGVMAGLFFSSGEGIRLFPFAHYEKVKETKFKLEAGTSNSYSYSVHNNTSNSFSTKNKAQKNLRDLNSLTLNSNEDQFKPFIELNRVILQNYYSRVFLKNSDVTALPSDRAPPLV